MGAGVRRLPSKCKTLGSVPITVKTKEGGGKGRVPRVLDQEGPVLACAWGTPAEGHQRPLQAKAIAGFPD